MLRNMFPNIAKSVNTISPILAENANNFEYRMNFDGCSKGNPGICGAGAVIYYNNVEIWADSFFVGENATNNRAEYAGLILGLQQAAALDIKHLLVQGDSQLVINQMKGIYQCSSPNLISLYQKAKEIEYKFDTICYQHVLRNLNKRADYLSNVPVLNYKP